MLPNCMLCSIFYVKISDCGRSPCQAEHYLMIQGFLTPQNLLAFSSLILFNHIHVEFKPASHTFKILQKPFCNSKANSDNKHLLLKSIW